MKRVANGSEGDESLLNKGPPRRAFPSEFQSGDESPDVTGLILAGGKSRRMGRRNKAFLELGGRPLISIVIERVRGVCGEVLIVAGDTAPYVELGIAVVEDRFRGVGVLGGMHAGLDAASHEIALVVGCDLPFLNPALLQAFADWAKGFDVAVLRHAPPHSPPRSGGDAPQGQVGLFVEPLHAAYRRTCLPAIEAAIQAGERRIVSFFPHVDVRYVTQAEVASYDPDLCSFLNVNTPEEWTAVQEEWQRRSS